MKSTSQHIAENILNREFTAAKPNGKWVTDVTEFKYGNSRKAYLSAIRDLYDGAIISYVLGHSNNNALVFETMDKALHATPAARSRASQRQGISIHIKAVQEESGNFRHDASRVMRGQVY